jgi:hypothetical protein
MRLISPPGPFWESWLDSKNKCCFGPKGVRAGASDASNFPDSTMARSSCWNWGESLVFRLTSLSRGEPRVNLFLSILSTKLS